MKRTRGFLVFSILVGAVVLGGVWAQTAKDVSFPIAGNYLISLPRIINTPTIIRAEQLFVAIPNCVEVRKLDESSDLPHIWNGTTCEVGPLAAGVEANAAACSSACFCIDTSEGKAYGVEVSAPGALNMTGSDGTLVIQLEAAGAVGSLSGTNQISLPFATPLASASELLADIETAVGANSVALVARLVAASGTLESYPFTDFAIVPGDGYQVQMNTTGTYIPSTFGGGGPVDFQGLTNSPLGNAVLNIDDSGNLVVSNIGATGNDGVRVENPNFGSRTAHEDWEELGIIATNDIDPLGSLGDGSRMNMSSSALTVARGLVQVSVELLKNGGFIEVRPDFSAVGSSRFTYEVLNGSIVVARVTGQNSPATGGTPVLSSDWPTRQAFSEFQWSAAVSITLPGLASVTGNELRIFPEAPSQAIADVAFFELTATSIPSITITQESFLGEPRRSIPTLWQSGAVALALLLLGSAAYALRRRRSTGGAGPGLGG